MAIVRGTKLAHKLGYEETVCGIPYITLMMMNAVVPRYNSEGGKSGASGGNKPKSLFDIADQIGKGLGC